MLPYRSSFTPYEVYTAFGHQCIVSYKHQFNPHPNHTKNVAVENDCAPMFFWLPLQGVWATSGTQILLW